jgi:magnesium transporter
MANQGVEAKLSDPITAHMRTDFVQLREDQTVAEALIEVRNQAPRERILYFYVVDQQGRLRGVVPTRRLLLATSDQRIQTIMHDKVVAIPASATVLDACEFFVMHRYLAFPIINAERQVIGVVDVELYTEEFGGLDGEEQDDLFQLIGVHVAAARQTAPLAAFRHRFPWLLCNVASGIIAAFLSGLFAAELAQVVALALFVPVVLALAEGVSIQSVTLALQVMHGRRPQLGQVLRRSWIEVRTGVLLGVPAGAIVAAVGWLWWNDGRLALAIFGGIVGGMSIAATVGLLLPQLLRVLRLDPRVAAGPIALAFADMITLLCYFNIARFLYA